MTIEVRQAKLRRFRQQEHAGCVACGEHRQSRGLHLDFQCRENGAVAAVFNLGSDFAGYADRLHGGVVASILDSAMTNCLAASGVVAVTAELKVRFRKPVEVAREAEVRAMVGKTVSVIYYMQSEIIQDGLVRASASAKFVRQDKLAVL